MHTLRQRLNARDESGFTLIELLVVLIIIGILLAIAIPSYLGFQKSAQQTAAASDVREAIPSAEAYYNDNQLSYSGISATGLQASYDNGMQVIGVNNAANGVSQVIPSTAADGSLAAGQEYCISAFDGGQWAYVAGPGGVVKTKLTTTTDPCSGWTSGITTN